MVVKFICPDCGAKFHDALAWQAHQEVGLRAQLADAWDEGEKAGQANQNKAWGLSGEDISDIPNPYRAP